MAAPRAQFVVNDKQAEGLVKFLDNCMAHFRTMAPGYHTQLEIRDRHYMREFTTLQEAQRARQAQRAGDNTKIENTTVPIVESQVEAGVTYLTSVFLTDMPMFSVVSPPEYSDLAMQFNTLMLEHSQEGGWLREFQLLFKDGLKYNLGAVEVDWKEHTTYQPITVDVAAAVAGTKQKDIKEVVWAGNTVRRLDIYNIFFDARYTPAEVPRKGSYAGYHERLGREALMEFVQNLNEEFVDRRKEALESKSDGCVHYYVPKLNADALVSPDQQGALDGTFNWESWADPSVKNSPRIKYGDDFIVTTLYARIVPQDFNMAVPARNKPQIWKLIFVNGDVLVYAERLTNAHNRLPILLAQPDEDGLNLQTKSVAARAEPYQDMASALWNATLAAKRRAVFDRLLYDPTKVRPEDINNPNPVARIPVRPGAFGQPLNHAVWPFPYNDSQVGSMISEAQGIQEQANMATGFNRSSQGLFTKGNRTQFEYNDVAQRSDGRQRTRALFLEAQFFGPLKWMLKINIIQRQKPLELVNRTTGQLVKIDPAKLREITLALNVSDGLMPSDKLINGDLMRAALQYVGTNPLFQAEFDLVGMFVDYCKQHGSNWVEKHRRQPQQVANTMGTMRQLADMRASQQTGRPPEAAGSDGLQPPQQ